MVCPAGVGGLHVGAVAGLVVPVVPAGAERAAGLRLSGLGQETLRAVLVGGAGPALRLAGARKIAAARRAATLDPHTAVRIPTRTPKPDKPSL